MPLIPIEWKIIGIGISALALLCLLGAGAVVVDRHGYDRGVTVTRAAYEKLMADQAAANKAAIADANKALFAAADDLSKKSMELDDALSQIDATAGGVHGSDIGLDARRVRDLGAIK